MQCFSFTSSGTFTVPTNTLSITALIIGGGGGNSGNAAAGSKWAGGSGATSIITQTVTAGQIITVTIGAGGAGGASGANPGTGGGSTVFNGITAPGGGGATTSANGAAGTPSGGDVNLTAFYGYNTANSFISCIPQYGESFVHVGVFMTSDTSNRLPWFPGTGTAGRNGATETSASAGAQGSNGLVLIFTN